MNYTYIDGDNIGLKIESSFLDNDETRLIQINQDVIKTITKITNYFLLNDQEIIFSGADGIICKGKPVDAAELLNFVRNCDPSITFSIGTGNTLRESYIALRYAKALNKNILVHFEDSAFQVTAE
jgi:hypothetical protein